MLNNVDKDNMNHKKLSGMQAFIKLIKKSIHDGSPILSWVNINNKRVIKKVQVIMISVPKKRLTVKISEMEDDYKKAIVNKGELHFFITNNACIFKLELAEAPKEGFNFVLPENFTRIERRRSLRLDCVAANINATVSFSKVDLKLNVNKYNKVCNDFSSSGFSINVNTNQSHDFEKGEYVREINIAHKELSIVASACLIYKEKSSPNKNTIDTWRLGFEFLNINPKQKSLIERFVLKNTTAEQT